MIFDYEAELTEIGNRSNIMYSGTRFILM